MFILSLVICKIFAKIIKCRKFLPWKWRSREEVEERDLRHSTGNVRVHIGDFFRILATWEGFYTNWINKYTAKDRVEDYRQNLQSRFAKKSNSRVSSMAKVNLRTTAWSMNTHCTHFKVRRRTCDRLSSSVWIQLGPSFWKIATSRGRHCWTLLAVLMKIAGEYCWWTSLVNVWPLAIHARVLFI